MPQAVRANPLADPCGLGDPPDHLRSGISGHAFTADTDEQRTLEPLIDRQVQSACGPGCQWDGDGLATLAVHDQGAVASLEAKLFDVGAESFGDAQTVQCEQRAQRMVPR